MKLNKDNYYSVEANQYYFSNSQYKSFLDCEAKALAEIEGRFTEPPSQAFLAGNFFHTDMQSPQAHNEFLNENMTDIYKFKNPTKKQMQNDEELYEIRGDLKVNNGMRKEFEDLYEIKEQLLEEPKIRQLHEIKGESEKIMTGKLFDEFDFKIAIDKYIDDPFRLLIDWKTTEDIYKLKYSAEWGERVSFIRYYNYIRAAAIYLEIEKQFTKSDNYAAFYIVAVTKQNPADKGIFLMNHEASLQIELESMYEKLHYYQKIKNHQVKPLRCGRCAYCRGTKQIKDIKTFTSLDLGSTESLEEDYDLTAEVHITK